MQSIQQDEHFKEVVYRNNSQRLIYILIVTTLVMFALLIVDFVHLKFTQQDVPRLINWLPQLTVIVGNLLCYTLSQIYTHYANNRKLFKMCQLYVYFLIITGAFISLMNDSNFGDLMLYTIIVFMCSAYFIMYRRHFALVLTISSLVLYTGFFFKYESDWLVLFNNCLYVLFIHIIAYIFAKSNYISFRKTVFSQEKLIREMEENRLLTKELQRANQQLQLQSSVDPLTKLRNRHAVNDFMNQLQQRADRESFLLSSIMLDVDYFKQYNDRYGHLAGDEVLLQIGHLLLQIEQRFDVFVARWGGEEFMLLLINGEHKVEKICEEIIIEVEKLCIVHEDSPVNDMITVSIGAHNVLVQAPQDVLQSVRFADDALYDVKAKGRNGYTIA